MPEYDYLTAEDKQAIKAVIGGADVLSLKLAKQLRSIEEKQNNNGHKLIDITPSMGDYSVTDRLPYFGCFVFQKGILAANRTDEDA